MIVPGHYVLNDIACSMDWIDTEKLISNGKMLEKIVAVFEEMIIDKIQATELEEKKAVVIGIGNVGLIIGSILAYRLSKPFVYEIPRHVVKYYDRHDLNGIEFDEDHEYIIITDVVVTGVTIYEVYKYYNNYNIRLDRILGIFSIFERQICNNSEPEKSKDYQDVLKLVKPINTEFDVDLKYKEQCILNNDRDCICSNPIMN